MLLRLWYFGSGIQEKRWTKTATTTAGADADQGDEKELQGLYSNLMMIHHNVEEFTLNFVYIFPTERRASC